MRKLLENNSFQFIILIIATSAIIGNHYKAIFENLGSNKTSDIYRDGIKTVLNATYHAKYSDSYTWFGGMNYPYEEHIMAATELPGFAILFKFLNPTFPWITDYAFGIIHLFLMLSILLGCIFIYLIFKELKIPWHFAFLFSIAICFLAPQNMRLSSHMGLAPLFALPAIIYFILKIEKTAKIKHAVWLCAFTFLSAFLHFYFFAIIAIFVSLYFFSSGFKILFFPFTESKWPLKTSNSKINSITQLIFYYFIGIGIPLSFFLFWMILNDPITDRSPNPFGFLVYHSNFTNIFSSPHLPLYEWINDKWFQKGSVDFEGWSYIGLVADLFLIVVLLKWIINPFKRNIFHFVPESIRPFLFKLLFAGGVMAYLSCSQPFIMEGWEHLLQYTGPYKQFRSTGRFAWAFYFSINTIAFTGFYFLFQTNHNKKIKAFLFFSIISLSLYEAYTFHNSEYVFRQYKLRYAPELEPGKEFTSVTDIDFSKYQAIIPSPLFLVGTNNIEMPGSAYIIQQALVLSNQTGLPVTGAMLTRSSHGQGLNQLQLVSEPYRIPEIFKDIKNKKPFILLESKTNKEEFELKFGHLRNGATLLHKNERWSLYELPLESFQKRIGQKINTVKSEIANDSLFQIGEFLSSDSIKNFVYNNFNGYDCENNYFTEGCYSGIVGRDNYLFIGQLPNAKTNIDYSMHLWVNIKPDRFATTLFQVIEKNKKGHSNIIGQTNPAWGYKVFDKNGWVLLEIPFSISSPENEITITFKKLEDYDMRLMSVDELLIKPVNSSLYRQSENYIWKNNRIYFQ